MNISEAYKQILESEEEVLKEGIIKKTLVGAAIVGAGLLAHQALKSAPEQVQKKEIVATVEHPEKASLVKKVLSKYKIGNDKADQIVSTVLKHTDDKFPTAKDVLSVIGNESTFNEHAKSKLKDDPAVGLTQIRKGIWNLNKGELDTIDGQVKHGIKILRKYHEKLGNPDAALAAYNVGIGNYRSKKVQNPQYVVNFHNERKMYNDI